MMNQKTQWHNTVPGGLISSNEIHVWRLLLKDHNSPVEKIKEFLSADELVRAEKFYFEKDQNRFIMARGVLRMILGAYLEMKPHELRFEYTSFGKPILAEKTGSNSICFNLSHSADMVLYSVSSNRNIGIDVERVNENTDVMQIATRFFTANEINALERCNKKEQAELFFQYWTRKEALVKGLGKGISFPIEQIDVSAFQSEFLMQVNLPVESRENSCLYIRDLFPGAGYAAAIAVEGSDWELSCREYAV